MRALFLGEGKLDGPARYLAAALHWAKLRFDHRPDQAKIPIAWRKRSYDVIILSDYRYASWTARAREWLVDAVTEGGAGFLMIGGWASFTGLVGGYAGTALERLLPVSCARVDDRMQKATGALLVPTSGRAALKKGLPVVCGYHRAMPKPGTQVTHVFRDLNYRAGRVTLGKAQPALVLGRAGRARTAAFLSDCAPHWAGGFVDWGRRRVKVPVAPGITVELGQAYLTFWKNLLAWLSA